MWTLLLIWTCKKDHSVKLTKLKGILRSFPANVAMFTFIFTHRNISGVSLRSEKHVESISFQYNICKAKHILNKYCYSLVRQLAVFFLSFVATYLCLCVLLPSTKIVWKLCIVSCVNVCLCSTSTIQNRDTIGKNKNSSIALPALKNPAWYLEQDILHEVEIAKPYLGVSLHISFIYAHKEPDIF